MFGVGCGMGIVILWFRKFCWCHPLLRRARCFSVLCGAWLERNCRSFRDVERSCDDLWDWGRLDASVWVLITNSFCNYAVCFTLFDCGGLFYESFINSLYHHSNNRELITQSNQKKYYLQDQREKNKIVLNGLDSDFSNWLNGLDVEHSALAGVIVDWIIASQLYFVIQPFNYEWLFFSPMVKFYDFIKTTLC